MPYVVPAVAAVLAAWVAVHLLRTASRSSTVPWFAGLATLAVLVGLVWPPAFFVGFPLLLAAYPDGRFVPRWSLVVVLLGVVAAFVPQARTANMVTSLALLAAQVFRYRRRSSTAEREAVRWVLLGTLVTVACYASIAAVTGTIGGTPRQDFVADLASIPVAVGLTIGLVRPRGRLDVDQALRAVVVGYATVPTLAVGYLLASRQSGWLGAAVVAVLGWPVGAVAVRLADWLVYRGRPDPRRAAAHLLERLAERRDPAPQVVLEEVRRAVYLDEGRITGSWFQPIGAGGTEMVPVDYRGERLAELWLSPRRGESDLTARDRRVINELVTHAAPALDGARSLAELRESRSRVVAAREEERRRLRRDLHDDLGPALAGLSLSAAALARRTGLPEAAELHDDIQDAMRQSREIAYGLRPPILDDHGLVAAILDRTAADDELLVEVSAPDPLALPAAVDLAALRIVVEAVNNVRKHASASRVDIDLAVGAGVLSIAVTDDGRGLPAEVQPGIGMHSIAERAAEVDGSAHYDRQARGCRLLVSLPLEGR